MNANEYAFLNHAWILIFLKCKERLFQTISNTLWMVTDTFDAIQTITIRTGQMRIGHL